MILRTLKESHALGIRGETHSGLILHTAVEVKKVCRAQWTQQGASGSSSGLLQLPPDRVIRVRWNAVRTGAEPRLTTSCGGGGGDMLPGLVPVGPS